MESRKTYESMTYEEAAAYIEETPKFTKKNTLDNTKAILRHLGDPQERMKILHVAGTNGKSALFWLLCCMRRESIRDCLFRPIWWR